MIAWLANSLTGKILSTLVISMVPVIELRGGLPFGIAQGLDYPLALAISVLGNMIPVPFIIMYIRYIFKWLQQRSTWWNQKIKKLEDRAHVKGRMVHRYRTVGLFILVAIPLPGTGVWTGALVAGCLGMQLKEAIPSIFLGVCAAAGIITVLTYGVIIAF